MSCIAPKFALLYLSTPHIHTRFYPRLPILKKGGIQMIKRVEIYFNDLEPEAQGHLLEVFETTEEDENWDIFPITVIEREVEVDDLYT